MKTLLIACLLAASAALAEPIKIRITDGDGNVESVSISETGTVADVMASQKVKIPAGSTNSAAKVMADEIKAQYIAAGNAHSDMAEEQAEIEARRIRKAAREARRN